MHGIEGMALQQCGGQHTQFAAHIGIFKTADALCQRLCIALAVKQAPVQTERGIGYRIGACGQGAAAQRVEHQAWLLVVQVGQQDQVLLVQQRKKRPGVGDGREKPHV